MRHLIQLFFIIWLLPQMGLYAGAPASNLYSMNPTNQPPANPDTAVFGGGCFWCTEAIFSRLHGVHSVYPGYAGGHTPNPSYEQVKSGTTGHAEVVRIVFDPGKISFGQLLEVFFRTHDPTTLNRQGADVGTQYRSVILYRNQEQKEVATKVREALDQAGIWDQPMVTEVTPLDVFWVAEEYHHNYFARNPNQAYCQVVILPKVRKFKKLFEDLLAE